MNSSLSFCLLHNNAFMVAVETQDCRAIEPLEHAVETLKTAEQLSLLNMPQRAAGIELSRSSRHSDAATDPINRNPDG